MTTIGVTLEVPDPWASELQRYRLGLGDTSGEGIPAHITLLGPVDVEREMMPDVLSHLEKVATRHGSFSVGLRGTGSFRPVSRVVFIRVAEGADGCAALAEAVRTGPLGFDSEFSYHPHVTIAHDVADEVLDRAAREHSDFECSFAVDHLRVYHYAPRAGWVPLADLPLSEER